MFSCDWVPLLVRLVPWCQLKSDDKQMVCLQLSCCSRTCCVRELKLGRVFARYYMSDPWTVIPPCVSVCHPLTVCTMQSTQHGVPSSLSSWAHGRPIFYNVNLKQLINYSPRLSGTINLSVFLNGISFSRSFPYHRPPTPSLCFHLKTSCWWTPETPPPLSLLPCNLKERKKDTRPLVVERYAWNLPAEVCCLLLTAVRPLVCRPVSSTISASCSPISSYRAPFFRGNFALSICALILSLCEE